MKKLLLSAIAGFALVPAQAEISQPVNVQGRECTLQTLQTRQIGPGTTYYRYRVPEFPLNINVVTVDTHNPNIKIETNLPNDRSAGTELLVGAAARHDRKDHHVIAAQNGNFWIVSSQPMWNAYGASTHGVNLRNGMLAIDSKSYPNWWWWRQKDPGVRPDGTEAAGIVATTDNNELFIDVCRSVTTIKNDKIGTLDQATGKRSGVYEYASCNKGFRHGQISIYTPWFGADRQFIPLADPIVEGHQGEELYNIQQDAVCTEVMLKIADGETWTGGRDMDFVVAEVRKSNGLGTIGSYDLAIVGRDEDVNLYDLVPGDVVKVNYSWVYNRGGKEVTPLITQAIAGNMMVMKDGKITDQNYWDGYNTMVYSRSAYGTSADNRTLYMITIDKSTDAFYGISAGCTTADMVDIVREIGVHNLINVDAGGSAELLVDGRIINVTTEGTPRAVGNGWMVFNTAPDDDTAIASLAVYDVEPTAPVNAIYSPRVIAFNQYGTVLDNDFKDFTISIDPSLGTAKGNSMIAGSEAGSGVITVSTADGISASATLTLVNSAPSLRRKNIVLDAKHSYPIEVRTLYNKTYYNFDAASIAWTSDHPEVAYVDQSGTLHSVANGTATINGKMTGLDDNIAVSVENSAEPMRSLVGNWTDWAAKGITGLKNITLGEDGKLSYTYNNVRGRAWVSFTKDMTLYGLPYAVTLEFESDVPVTEVELNLRTYDADKQSKCTYAPEGGIPANTPTKVVFNVADLDQGYDISDCRIYPLTLSTLKFYSPAATSYKGDHYLQVKSLIAEYDTEGGVDNVAADDRGILVSPNPVEAGATISVSSATAIESLSVYDLAGRLVSNAAPASENVSLTAPGVPGTYVVRAVAAGSATTSLLIVR